MGIRYSIVVQTFADANFTQLVSTYGTTMGIAIASPTFTSNFHVADPDVSVFESYIATNQRFTLGCPYQYYESLTGINTKLFMPNANPLNIENNQYIRIRFHNGARIDRIPIGVASVLISTFYDKDGNYLFSSGDSFIAGNVNGWYGGIGYVVNSIENNQIGNMFGILSIGAEYSGGHWRQTAGGSAPSLRQDLANFFNIYVGIPADTGNPYDINGNTEPGGGDGISYDNIPNDPIDFPTQLSITASNANFISIWTPTLDQVQSLAAWLWTTDPVKVAFWQKLLQNPLELIFSLAILPIPIHHTDDPSEPDEEEIAHIDSLSLGWQDTGLPMDWIDKQYVTVDMGTIELEEVWGAFLDYEPYTKIDIFLPYIGTKHLDTNDCMPRNISLKYIIDLATGTCLALIKCDESVYYHFSGNCASQIPITVNQCQEIVRGLMTMAVGAATFAVGGAVGAGAHASKAAAAKGAAMKAGGAAMVGSGADNAAKGVNVSRSGTISCAAGLMDVQTPYLIISRPKQAMPEEQNKYTGYPSFITRELSDLEGYTEVQIIHLEEIPCTENELREIDELLVAGVIL